MALVTVRPGIWTAVFNSVALGITLGDGFKLKYRRKNIPINNTNLYGDQLIDGIYRGLGGMQMLVTFKEWNAALQHAMNPFGTTSPPVFDGIPGAVGQLDSAKAQALVLSAASGTPDAAISKGGVANANTFTAGLAILAPENDIEFLMGPVETDVTLLFDLLLYDDSGTKRFFEWSNV